MRRARLISVSVLIACGACGSDPEPAGPDPNASTALLRFAVSDDLRKDPKLTGLVGHVYGSLYLKEDVSLTGPRRGAENVGEIELAGVDIRNTATSTASWRSAKLAPASDLVFLGFFDVDGNAGDDRDPDPGDPVTLPLTNAFRVSDAAPTDVRVVFDLLLN